MPKRLGRDLLGKIDGAAEGHVGPPGYYLMTIWVTFWPWTPLALLALPLAWAQRRSEPIRFLAGWIIPTWAVFAVATTKLPHYVMPILPAVGGLVGLWLLAPRMPPRPVLQWIAAALFLVGGARPRRASIGGPLWFEGRIFPSALALALRG
jgi:4-amino-4-deoxy-L-arabinose transferase-like glycosyltransferase